MRGLIPDIFYAFRAKIYLNLFLPARLSIQLRVAVFHTTSSSMLNTKCEGERHSINAIK